MSKEGTKITERLQYENEEKKPILNILLIVNNYFKTFNIVSYLVRWHQAAEFTWSFWEASWKAGMESAGSQHIEKTNRQMVIFFFVLFFFFSLPLFLPSCLSLPLPHFFFFWLLKIYCLSVLTDDVFIGSNEVPAVFNNNRTLLFLRYIMCFPSSFSLE